MVNVIWFGLIVIGVIVAALEGNLQAVNEAAFEGAKEGVTICFGLISILVFWLGMMKIARESGLLETFAKILSPVAHRLFPDVPKDHPAMGYILANMSANLFGLGNAATPMGIKAMEELQKLNPHKEKATPAMITLMALNTSSITLIPTTVIAIRLNYGSSNAVEIVGTTLFATFCSTLIAVMLDRWCRRRYGY
ncbi:nucleoside recognition domain protein [Caldalkalibacillus thermarum TA2.A1]|uniref:Nucleoside recognition domain protein n=1 Tax=Caldalkalibacillus thermarum (strain TA2.A1) TaxID=986075 RepID=F5L636_CALTT|nr:nucleoside recognition domain-containing protein [Caldalkalibacillus thermarum]EGL83190.1 nucleoside recognition domain protein [Caldalkalibacillus thermarum TA2.A1]GGK15357.1 spore maturation protein A [Caldalkalibacillus thermarum]